MSFFRIFDGRGAVVKPFGFSCPIAFCFLCGEVVLSRLNKYALRADPQWVRSFALCSFVFLCRCTKLRGQNGENPSWCLAAVGECLFFPGSAAFLFEGVPYGGGPRWSCSGIMLCRECKCECRKGAFGSSCCIERAEEFIFNRKEMCFVEASRYRMGMSISIRECLEG